MIEKIVERDKEGGIEKIYEREMSPIEEVVALIWPKVKHALRRRDVVDLEEVEVTIHDVVPTLHEMHAIANMLSDRIIREHEAFAHAKFRKVIFTFPRARQS